MLNQARGQGSALQSPALHPFSVHKTCACVEGFGNARHHGHHVVSARSGVLPSFTAAFPRERFCGADRWSRDLAGLFNDLSVRGLHVTSSHHVGCHSYLFLSRKTNLVVPNACCRKYALGSEATAMTPDVTSKRATYGDTSFARSMMDGSAPLRWPEL